MLPNLESGGVERGTVDIARAAAKEGFRSLVASAGGYLQIELKRAGAEHFTLPLDSKNPFTIWRNIRRLEKIIRNEKVDIIHARSRAPAWSAYFASIRTGIEFITTFHGVYKNGGKWKHKYNSIMVKGKPVIAISEFIEEHIKKNYHVSEKRIRTIPRGVDFDYFNPDNINPERIIKLTRAWNLPEEVPIIMMPARISRWKGHKFVIDALHMMPHKNFCCLFVGKEGSHTKYMKELQKKIKQMGLTNNCWFVGGVNDMPSVYALASVVVSPSTEPEAFGRIPIEAASMERICIATNIGGAKETIQDGKTGFLVEPNDPKQLAETLDKVLNMNESERRKITEKAKQFVRQNYSLKQMFEKTISVYMEVLQ